MKDIKYYLGLLGNINRMYIDVLNGCSVDINLLDSFNVELSNIPFKEFNVEEKDILSSVVTSCVEQVNLINYLVMKREFNVSSIDGLREEFVVIEKERFNIINSYIVGILKKSEIDRFEELWSCFKEKLYQYSPLEDELLEVAKMKSKMQHFSTEIFEDEEVLRVAYRNE